jgi:hypothetical protein
MGRRAGRGIMNIDKTSVKIASFPPHTLERVMTTLSAWKFSTLQGAGEAPAKLEKLNRDFLINPHDEAVVQCEVDKKKPTVIPVWRFCEGACEHAFLQ